MPTTVSAINKPFDEAVEYFRQKVSVPSSHWTTVMDEANARAFAVAGATSDALIADFRAAVDKAISKGTTLQEFRQDFASIVAKHGWAHKGTAEWRARIIYQTNLANAFSAGRYAQQTDPAVLAAYPYWEYVHVNCPHPRLQHVAWSGTILPANDPWWSTHYTPNGWGCHCIVMNLGPRDLARRKIDPASLKAPPIQWQEYINRTTGVVTRHPAGIDPGFAYNPGEAWKTRARQPLKAEAVRPVGPPPPVLAPPGKDAVAPAVLRKFLADPQGSVQVGKLTGAAEAHLGTGQAPVLLSAETMAKQAAKHPEMTAADYEQLEQLLSVPELVLAERVRHVRLIGKAGDRVVTAVVKRTGKGHENYIITFHRLRLDALAAYLKRDKTVAGDAPALLDWLKERTR